MDSSVDQRLTFLEFEALPDPGDGLRRELIDGRVVVSPAPVPRHGLVVAGLITHLNNWGWPRGVAVVEGPGLLAALDSEPIPDILVVLPDRSDRIGEKRVAAPADLVIEVSSPSTRRYDLGRKRELYEAAGTDEYWFVDLTIDAVLVHRLKPDDRYGEPHLVHRGATLSSPRLDGFALPIDVLFDGPARF